jgi:hypothetical protein
VTQRVDGTDGEGYDPMMGDSDPPPSSKGESRSSVPPPPPHEDSVPPPSPHPHPEEKQSRRKRLEGVIPELIKRAVEIGVEKARESPESFKHFVGDMKVPKEIASVVFQQLDETKNGVFRVVAKEMRDFLEHTNLAGEMQKLLTTVQFEINTTIRFRPNDGPDKERDEDEDGEESPESSTTTGLPKPEVKTAVHVRRDEKKRRPRE